MVRPSIDPADRVTLDDEVRLALLVMLERLTPAERVAFVLHDIFPRRSTSSRRPSAGLGGVPATGQPGAPQDPRISRYRRTLVEPAGHRAADPTFIAACANGDLENSSRCSIRTRPARSTPAGDFVVVRPAITLPATCCVSGAGPTSSWCRIPCAGDPPVLAFAERKLVGVIGLTIYDARPDHQSPCPRRPATLEPVRAQFFGRAHSP